MALFAATLTSCCSPCPPQPGKSTCCSSSAKAPSPKGKSCLPNIAGMPASCSGNCSSDDCGCVKHPCRCGVKKPASPRKVVAVAKPAPPPVVDAKLNLAQRPAPEITKPAPEPRVAPAPAPGVTVTERTYYWEFSNQLHKATIPPGSNPEARGFMANPQDRGWVKEREYRLPPGTPVPGAR